VSLPIEVHACEPGRQGAEAVERGHPGKLRVLLADDNRDAAASLAMLLEIKGHQVQVVHDGLEALRVAIHSAPDVAVLDIGMPGLSGYEVARGIRESPRGGSIRLVALTGWAQEEDRRRSAEAGFHHHLVKPVDPSVLFEILRPVD
jgi:two-component system CheB/CheR fusion protein